MSFVLDQVRRIDAHFDRLQLANLHTETARSPATETSEQDFPTQYTQDFSTNLPSKRVVALQTAIRSLSPGSSDSTSRALLRPYEIQQSLSALSSQPSTHAAISLGEGGVATDGEEEKEYFEQELEW